MYALSDCSLFLIRAGQAEENKILERQCIHRRLKAERERSEAIKRHAGFCCDHRVD